MTWTGVGVVQATRPRSVARAKERADRWMDGAITASYARRRPTLSISGNAKRRPLHAVVRRRTRTRTRSPCIHSRSATVTPAPTGHPRLHHHRVSLSSGRPLLRLDAEPLPRLVYRLVNRGVPRIAAVTQVGSPPDQRVTPILRSSVEVEFDAVTLLLADRGEEPRLQRASVIPAGNGQQSPTAASRWRISRTVDDATPTRRAISLIATPAAFERSSSRPWRIAVLPAGIVPSSDKRQRSERYAGQQRHPIRATSSRNGGRHRLGAPGEIIPDP